MYRVILLILTGLFILLALSAAPEFGAQSMRSYHDSQPALGQASDAQTSADMARIYPVRHQRPVPMAAHPATAPATVPVTAIVHASFAR